MEVHFKWDMNHFLGHLCSPAVRFLSAPICSSAGCNWRFCVIVLPRTGTPILVIVFRLHFLDESNISVTLVNRLDRESILTLLASIGVDDQV